MPTERIEEVRESHDVDEVNALLHTGWRLLAVHPPRRPQFVAAYILGVRTASEVNPLPALTDPER